MGQARVLSHRIDGVLKSKAWYRIRSNPLFLVGGGIILFFALVGAFAPLVAPHSPLDQNLDMRMVPGFWAGNFDHFMGTDEMGRDVFSRIVYGTRISLLLALASVLLVLVVGGVIGLVSGFFGGIVDTVIMRIVDIFMSFPYIILAIAVMAVFGQGIVNAVIAISIVLVPSVARVSRGVTLTLKSLQFVEAAGALGASRIRVMFKHLLPNLVPQLIVFGALLMGETILYIAALGFLGLGIQPPTPEWGAMISTGKDMLILGKWWMSAFPGVAITFSVTGFVLFGDGLRDLLDPRMRR